MKLTDVLSATEEMWTEWSATLAIVAAERMTEQGACGVWSVKDLMAHIAWYEREMVDLMETRVLKGSPWWMKPLDERNALIYEQNRDRTFMDVQDDANRTHLQLMQALTKLDDEAMINPKTYADMPDEWVPWQIIAGNTFWHYRDHAADIRKWLAK